MAERQLPKLITRVRFPSPAPTQAWWMWPSWLRRQIVVLEIVGSTPIIHPIYDPLAQLAEHLTFNQGVPRSSRGWVTNLF